MDAIVTAGGMLNPDDPLFAIGGGIEKKALIPMLGKPLIGWVLDALRGSGMVENIAVVGLSSQELNYNDPLLHFTPARGDLVSNIFAALDTLRSVNPQVKKLLIFSSDIPLVTPEIVRGFVNECGNQEQDFYYSAVEESVMEASFPDSKRTFVPFKDGRYSGGDALFVDVAAAHGNTKLARAATGSRKNYLAQARLLGFSFIIKFIFRMMTADEAVVHASKKANLRAKVVLTQYPELGMDVDKPHQYYMIEAELKKRIAKTT